MEKLKNATLGGGCFWCLEAVYSKLEGVKSVAPGYAGGTKLNPTYEQVCTGNTGHAEVIQIDFDPQKTSYKLCWTGFGVVTILQLLTVREETLGHSTVPLFSMKMRHKKLRQTSQKKMLKNLECLMLQLLLKLQHCRNSILQKITTKIITAITQMPVIAPT